MPTLKLSFHGTFALKKQDVLKLLEAAETEQGLNGSLMELVERTGLGNEESATDKKLGSAIRISQPKIPQPRRGDRAIV